MDSNSVPFEGDVLDETNLSPEEVPSPVFRSWPVIDLFNIAEQGDTQPEFMPAEHRYLGDSITLRGNDHKPYTARDRKFTLPNKLELTYGQINALAGDFYGTREPISDVSDFSVQKKRFLAAFDTLGVEGKHAPREAVKIIKELEREVREVEDAVRNHRDPSSAYAKLKQNDLKLNALTMGRPHNTPSFFGLALRNWDHFGEDARKAYKAGHATALEIAARGELQLAYCANAFADHFLQDAFAAGHLRTPRRAMHGGLFDCRDVLSLFMHDEENAIGLKVQNSNNQTWMIYGDKRLLDGDGKVNYQICQRAVQVSANEVYAAWETKKMPDPSHYAVWKLLPSLDAVQRGQELAPLFRNESGKLACRSKIENRRDNNYTTHFSDILTLRALRKSKWWHYPITIDGPKR